MDERMDEDREGEEKIMDGAEYASIWKGERKRI